MRGGDTSAEHTRKAPSDGAKPPPNTDLVSVPNDLLEMRAMHKSAKVLAPSASSPSALKPFVPAMQRPPRDAMISADQH